MNTLDRFCFFVNCNAKNNWLMKYTEFEKAAQRHLQTCQKLKVLIEGNNLEDVEKENLLKNLFYLAGYVVECSFKFAFFAKLRREVKQSSNDDVTFLVSVYNAKIRKGKFKEVENGIVKEFSYKKHFSLLNTEEEKASKEIIAYLRDKFRPTPASNYYNFLLNQSHIEILASKWDSQVRYFIEFQLEEKQVLAYIEDAERIFLTSKAFDKSPKYS